MSALFAMFYATVMRAVRLPGPLVGQTLVDVVAATVAGYAFSGLEHLTGLHLSSYVMIGFIGRAAVAGAGSAVARDLRAPEIAPVRFYEALPALRLFSVGGVILGETVVWWIGAAARSLFAMLLLSTFSVQRWLVLSLAIGVLAFLGACFGALASARISDSQVAPIAVDIFVTPQLILCGGLVPTEDIPRWLRIVRDLFPLRYGYDLLHTCFFRGMKSAPVTLRPSVDIAVVLGFAFLAFVGAMIKPKKQIE